MNKMRNDIVELVKLYSIEKDGEYRVYEKKPTWKYRRLRKDCRAWILLTELKEILGYMPDPIDSVFTVNDDKYFVRVFVKEGTKLKEALEKLGFFRVPTKKAA